MIPDWLVYDELKRRREQEHHIRQWEPERLELPLYQPDHPGSHIREDSEEEDDDGDLHRGVIIIDMNDGTDIG